MHKAAKCSWALGCSLYASRGQEATVLRLGCRAFQTCYLASVIFTRFSLHLEMKSRAARCGGGSGCWERVRGAQRSRRRSRELGRRTQVCQPRAPVQATWNLGDSSRGHEARVLGAWAACTRRRAGALAFMLLVHPQHSRQ